MILRIQSSTRRQRFFSSITSAAPLILAKRIPKLFMKISLKSFGTNAGFEYAFPESSGNEARFNIVRCPYYETCKRYGCPEITTAFCDGDDAGYGNLHPRLIWWRTKTIGRGDECCNFLLQYWFS